MKPPRAARWTRWIVLLAILVFIFVAVIPCVIFIVLFFQQYQ